MTEEHALLAAICAKPEDDTPRLVYADWLQERGQDDRAEFIRTQIELTRKPECERCKTPVDRGANPKHKTGCQCERLRERDRELLEPARDWFDVPGWETIWNRWPQGGCGHLTWVPRNGDRIGIEVFVRRGFVDEVHIRAEQFLLCADQIYWHRLQRIGCYLCKRTPTKKRTCPACGHDARITPSGVKRPFVAATQPIRAVVLTTLPTSGYLCVSFHEQYGGEANRQAVFWQLVNRPKQMKMCSLRRVVTVADLFRWEWPRIEFTLPAIDAATESVILGRTTTPPVIPAAGAATS